MGRIVEKLVAWTDSQQATLRIRVWSFRDRDIWERRYGLAGDTFMGAMIGALGGKKLGSGPGGSVAKEIQLARTLAEDQRQRIAAQGGADVLDKICMTLVSVELPGSDAPAPWTQDEEGRAALRAWLEQLDADLFDRIAKAVDSVLYIRADEEKDEKKT